MYLQEAKQAIELMGRWEMIDVCDALELLSPVFESEEVSIAHKSLIVILTCPCIPTCLRRVFAHTIVKKLKS